MKIERRPSTAIYPVPIVLVTVGAGEQANIITIAWTGTVNSEPPMVAVSVRPGRHSYPLLCSGREFVVNVPRRAQAETVDLAGIESGAKLDKFAAYGLTAAPASHVRPPLIAECPINIECVVRTQMSLGTHDLFIGEVLAVHYDEEILDAKGHIDVAAADLFAYADGGYWSLGERIAEHGFTAPIARKRRQSAKQGRRPAGR
jgi:flavin reductase (DIM6/NTAB) family NADH-FMN oxidoreductase RutF